MAIIEKPCVNEIEKYLNKWNKNERFVKQDEILYKYFLDVYPSNDNFEGVLLKIFLLNDYYTAFYKNNNCGRTVYSVADKICNMNKDGSLDAMLKEKDISCVDKIFKETNLYVFATKYCSFHMPETYPMYDSKVEVVFKYCRDHYGFRFENDELKRYSKYVKLYDRFKEQYGLEYDYKIIDQYLWQVGKEYIKAKQES